MVDRAAAPPGTWVRVWAQVTDEPAHPEDISVEVFSHSDQFGFAVLRSRVEVAAGPPGFAPRCTDLGRSMHNEDQETDGALLVQCIRHDAHPDVHEASDGTVWTDQQTVGYFEAKS